MKVRLTHYYAGHALGDEIDLPEAEARDMIRARGAVPVGPAVETATDAAAAAERRDEDADALTDDEPEPAPAAPASRRNRRG